MDWSLSTRNMSIVEETFNTEKGEIFFLDSTNDNVIVPHPSVLSQLELDPKALVLKTKTGEPLAHFQSLSRAFQSFLQPRMKIGREYGYDFMVFST